MAFQAGAIEAKLGLDTKPFATGIADAGRMAGGFATATSSKLSGLGAGAFGALKGGAAKGLAAAGQVVIGALRKIGEDITGVVEGLAGRVLQTMNGIDDMGKAATSLGMTAEAFSSLAYEAKLSGMSNQDFAQTLNLMENNLGDAAMGVGTAKTALDAMGLSAKSLVNLSPDQAFKKIADGVQKLPNAFERANAAMNIFGRGAGPHLKTLLADGSAGIEKQQAAAKAMGATINDIDSHKVQDANDAMTKAGTAIETVLLRAAVEVAPYIKGIADGFSDAALKSGGFGGIATSAVGAMATGIAYASDVLNLFSAGWNTFEGSCSAAVAGAIRMILAAGQAITDLLNMLPGVHVQMESTLSFGGTSINASGLADLMSSQATDDFKKAGQAMSDFASGKNHKAVNQFFQDCRDKADKAAQGVDNMGGAFKGVGEEAASALKKITDAMADVDKQIAQFGMTDSQKMLDDFKHMQGVTPEQIKAQAAKIDTLRGLKGDEFVKGLQDQVSSFGMSDFDKQRADVKKNPTLDSAQIKAGLELVDKLEQATKDKQFDDKVKSFRESVETPLQSFNKQLDFLQDALATGKITSGEFDAGAAKARKDAFGEDKLPSLIKSGSADAFKARFDAQHDDKNSPIAIARKQLDEQEKSRKRLDQIAEAANQDATFDGEF